MAIKTPRLALAISNRPRSLSLSFYPVIYLMLDRFNAAGWVWGVVATFCAIYFVGNAIDMLCAKDVSLEDLRGGKE